MNTELSKLAIKTSNKIQSYIEEQIERECEWTDVPFTGDDYRLFVAMTTLTVCENIIKDLKE